MTNNGFVNIVTDEKAKTCVSCCSYGKDCVEFIFAARRPVMCVDCIEAAVGRLKENDEKEI